jgi:transglutaminase-like putative cysteine protease
MKRRHFLHTAGAATAALSLPRAARALAAADAAGWRTFEVTTSVEVLKPAGVTRVWLPLPLIADTSYHQAQGNAVKAEGGQAHEVKDASTATGILAAEWAEGVRPVLTLTSRVRTRDRATDFARSASVPVKERGGLERYLQPSSLIPTDGIVKATAEQAIRGASTDEAKARAIYEWIVDNTFRDPKVKGCGRGDIRQMLESKNLGGKCADINALYVGMARAAGLPARDVYGLRLAKSRQGFKSLGPATEVCTKGQHCRAEVYLAELGWVPVDPADVRKVVLEEPPGNLTLDDPRVRQARAQLFGSWEMNWMAYNYGHDVALPGSKGPAVAFLMYPQGETAQGRLDPLDPDGFKYSITVREL